MIFEDDFIYKLRRDLPQPRFVEILILKWDISHIMRIFVILSSLRCNIILYMILYLIWGLRSIFCCTYLQGYLISFRFDEVIPYKILVMKYRAHTGTSNSNDNAVNIKSCRYSFKETKVWLSYSIVGRILNSLFP